MFEEPDSRVAGSEDRGWEPSPGVLVDLPAEISGPHPKDWYGNESESRLMRSRLVVMAGTGRGGAARNGEGVVASLPANKCGCVAMSSASHHVTTESSRDLVFTMSLKLLLSYVLRSGTKQAALKVSRLTFNKVSSAAVKFSLAENSSHFIAP